MDVYEITHLPTNKKYVGATYKKNKTYLDRFDEHLNGLGSVMIANMLANGENTSNFIITLLYRIDNIHELFELERKHILQYKAIDMSLNINTGGGPIIHSCYKNSIYDEYGYDENIFVKKYKPSHIQVFIDNINGINTQPLEYNVKLQIKQTLSKSYIISELYTNINYISYKEFYNIFSNDILLLNEVNYRITKYPNCRYDIISSYIHDKSIQKISTIISSNNKKLKQENKEKSNLFFNYFFLSKHANIFNYFKDEYKFKINSPTDTDGWKDGRQKFNERMANREFTEKEYEKFVHTANLVKTHWDNQTDTYITNRTTPGLNIMNEKNHICIHCGKSGLTLGNLKRHHNDNCKKVVHNE